MAKAGQKLSESQRRRIGKGVKRAANRRRIKTKFGVSLRRVGVKKPRAKRVLSSSQKERMAVGRRMAAARRAIWAVPKKPKRKYVKRTSSVLSARGKRRTPSGRIVRRTRTASSLGRAGLYADARGHYRRVSKRAAPKRRAAPKKPKSIFAAIRGAGGYRGMVRRRPSVRARAPKQYSGYYVDKAGKLRARKRAAPKRRVVRKRAAPKKKRSSASRRVSAARRRVMDFEVHKRKPWTVSRRVRAAQRRVLA